MSIVGILIDHVDLMDILASVVILLIVLGPLNLRERIGLFSASFVLGCLLAKSFMF